MKPFAYVKAANEQQALAALGRERGKILPLAGGMDLVSLLKDRIATPDRLVNVKGLDATIVATPDGGLRIGAAVRLVDLQGMRPSTRSTPHSCRLPRKWARRRFAISARSAAI